MSRHLEKINGENVESIDDMKKCRWLYDEVCCNGMSDCVADFPSAEYCSKCVLFTKEVKRRGKKTELHGPGMGRGGI